jgi:hypothetical protein
VQLPLPPEGKQIHTDLTLRSTPEASLIDGNRLGAGKPSLGILGAQRRGVRPELALTERL